MTIKQQGGIFGRNPTFNDVDVDGTLTVGGSAVPAGSDIASLSTANEFTQEQEIRVVDATAYDASAADAQVTVGPSLFLNNPANSNSTVAGQVVFGLRSTPYYARLGATGGSNPNIFVGLGTSEIARFTSSGLALSAGQGINFSATAGTGTSELFDDYEEGTWTPVIRDASSGGNTGGGSLTGYYTKIGNIVFLTVGSSNLTTVGMTSDNDLFITGLPFSVRSKPGSNYYTGAVIMSAVATTGNIAAGISEPQDYIRLYETVSNSGFDYITVGDLISGSADIRFTLIYEAS